MTARLIHSRVRSNSRQIVPMSSELTAHIVELMDAYVDARKEVFKQHPLHETVRALRVRVERTPAVQARPTLKVRASIGMGNWAVVPWIAILDTRETTTTRKGVYVILLFRADMTGFYVTLNQGIAQPMEHLGRSAARTALRERAAAIRERFPELSTLGSNTDAALELRASREFISGLDESTVAHRFFARDDLAKDDGYLTSVGALLDVYDRYLAHPIALQASGAMRDSLK